jgi:hypothetical protein
MAVRSSSEVHAAFQRTAAECRAGGGLCAHKRAPLINNYQKREFYSIGQAAFCGSDMQNFNMIERSGRQMPIAAGITATTAIGSCDAGVCCLPVSCADGCMKGYAAVLVNQDSQMGFNTIANSPEETSVMKSFAIKRIMLGISVAAMVAGSIPLAVAQDTNATTAQPDTSTAKPTKAERKAARKQARAKKNAELKKLEDAGYQPSRNDPNYPTNLQEAQKKAGIGAGASQ